MIRYHAGSCEQTGPRQERSRASSDLDSMFVNRQQTEYGFGRKRAQTHSVSVPALRWFSSDLEHIALAGNHLIQHGIDEESDEEPGNEAGHDDDGERLLSIRSDAGGKSGW